MCSMSFMHGRNCTTKQHLHVNLTLQKLKTHVVHWSNVNRLYIHLFLGLCVLLLLARSYHFELLHMLSGHWHRLRVR